MTRVFEGECHGTSAITVPESNQRLLLQDQKLAWRTALNSTDAVGTLAEKKASDLILWTAPPGPQKASLALPMAPKQLALLLAELAEASWELEVHHDHNAPGIRQRSPAAADG
jgi:hypothetical protein